MNGLNFRYWLAEVRREARSVQRECIEDDKEPWEDAGTRRTCGAR